MNVALNFNHTALPFQLMPGNNTVEIYRFGTYKHDTSPIPHRHKFDMVLWTTKGSGSHQIDFKDYEMGPGKLFFIRAGQMHMVKEYARDGWMILLKNLPIGSKLTGANMIDLEKDLPDTCCGLFSILQAELNKGLKTIEIIEPLLTAVLAGVVKKASYLSVVSEQLIMANELKNLIELCYKKQVNIYYYSKALGVGIRKLNSICREFFGYSVYELLHNRLLEESRLLLEESSKSVKEISYELGFEDPAYFSRWFRRLTGLAPLEYRRGFNAPVECVNCNAI